ncbi:phage portal protein family protein [Flavobacterium oreochromis]|uniref:DUF935 family protein n=1 Tax=Flavobacterium columnare TaxID=996 RepID=A0A246G9V7_9FLAO|nr:DUF935 family protein [Flavobacterium oreochromis]OWP76546.1 hypothetical protein BWK62_09415 [Flavobacterium oreochromis]
MSKVKNQKFNKVRNTVNLSGNAVKKISLSNVDTKNIEKVTNLMVDVIRRQRRLWRKEITDWQSARFAYYNSEMPRNNPIQEVYEDIELDGHLTGISEDRTISCVNENYIFSIDNVKDDELTKLIEDQVWFDDVLEMAHKSTYKGETFVWIKDFEKGKIKEVELIDRSFIVPNKKILIADIYANTGIDVSQVEDVLLYAKFYNSIGLFEKAAPYAILKRHSWGSWDEFEELFGVPIRIAKIASQSEQVKNEVAGWLEEMGSAPYGVFPIGTEIDIKENSKSDAFNVFYQKIKALDAELSKLVLHQTMTTENGSSKSQGEVHENTLMRLIKFDQKKMLSFLNNKLVPAMRLLGYQIPDNAKISIEKTKDPEKQITIDTELLSNGYVLTQNYIEGTYGVEIESMPSLLTPEGGTKKGESAKKR